MAVKENLINVRVVLIRRADTHSRALIPLRTAFECQNLKGLWKGDVSPGQRRRLKEHRVAPVPTRIRVTVPTPSPPNRGEGSRIDTLCRARITVTHVTVPR